jgi:hypothetical protein
MKDCFCNREPCVCEEEKPEEEKPCEREKDIDEWVCINDHTGCLWNDGHNGCRHEGDSLFPIKPEETLKITEVFEGKYFSACFIDETLEVSPIEHMRPDYAYAWSEANAMAKELQTIHEKAEVTKKVLDF